MPWLIGVTLQNSNKKHNNSRSNKLKHFWIFIYRFHSESKAEVGKSVLSEYFCSSYDDDSASAVYFPKQVNRFLDHSSQKCLSLSLISEIMSIEAVTKLHPSTEQSFWKCCNYWSQAFKEHLWNQVQHFGIVSKDGKMSLDASSGNHNLYSTCFHSAVECCNYFTVVPSDINRETGLLKETKIHRTPFCRVREITSILRRKIIIPLKYFHYFSALLLSPQSIVHSV